MRGDSELAFDIGAFMADFVKVAGTRDMRVHGAAREIGISSGSMSRYISRSYYPQAPQLAAMARWSGLNPADYVIQFGERLGVA